MDVLRDLRGAQSWEERLRFGDEFFAQVIPNVRLVIAHQCDPEVVDDVFENVVAAISKGLANFRGGQEKQFWAWCMRIVYCKCVDSLRNRDPAIPTDPIELTDLGEQPPQGEPLSPGERIDLEEALQSLRDADPVCYRYLWLRFLEGWSYAEIAREEGVKATTMRMRINRCLEAAQERLAARK